MFGEFGTVQSANLIEDRETGRSRGFGFVEMSSKEEGEAAIASMNGKEVDGRALTVNEAKPREDRGGSGGGGGGGGRGGYGGGGGGGRGRAALAGYLGRVHYLTRFISCPPTPRSRCGSKLGLFVET